MGGALASLPILLKAEEAAPPGFLSGGELGDGSIEPFWEGIGDGSVSGVEAKELFRGGKFERFFAELLFVLRLGRLEGGLVAQFGGIRLHIRKGV